MSLFLYLGRNLCVLEIHISAAEIYENFADMVKDKATIYISHRMSSSVFCDKIIVLNSGKIIDIDTHENLMKKENDLYYKLFRSQSSYYI